jgi:hypothetical protein
LLDAAEDRHLLSQLARGGSDAVAQKFDRQTQVRKLEDLYLGTMGSRAG